MGIAERRAREREALRARIVDVALDIVSQRGPDAPSMRAIAERIEYSPAAIYLHFAGKEDLLKAAVEEGFRRLAACLADAVESQPAVEHPAEDDLALGLAYARFALDNTAWFGLMFQLPTLPALEAPVDRPGTAASRVEERRRFLAGPASAEHRALVSWGLVHGRVSLYLGGWLGDQVGQPDGFMRLLGQAIRTLVGGCQTEERDA